MIATLKGDTTNIQSIAALLNLRSVAGNALGHEYRLDTISKKRTIMQLVLAHAGQTEDELKQADKSKTS
jgi:hypothetical protein